ncbi:MAG: hypothetical protein V3V29_06070 [Acidimicrobiia bacterium]
MPRWLILTLLVAVPVVVVAVNWLKGRQPLAYAVSSISYAFGTIGSVVAVTDRNVFRDCGLFCFDLNAIGLALALTLGFSVIGVAVAAVASLLPAEAGSWWEAARSSPRNRLRLIPRWGVVIALLVAIWTVELVVFSTWVNS